MRIFTYIFIFIIVLLLMPAFVLADEVGTIVAIRGTVIIYRDNNKINARLKDKIQLTDIIETKSDSKVKMLFKDDSILTLGENSKIFIKEYFYSKEKEKGKSIINLIDGKLRSLVGKNEFEVHTPTMIAAARGTYFIIWIEVEQGVTVSNIAVLDGMVNISNINPEIIGIITVQKGAMSKTVQNRPPYPSTPIPPTVLKELMNATELHVVPRIEKRKPPLTKKPLHYPTPFIKERRGIPITPPIDNQLPPNTTPVRIRIPIPEDL